MGLYCWMGGGRTHTSSEKEGTPMQQGTDVSALLGALKTPEAYSHGSGGGEPEIKAAYSIRHMELCSPSTEGRRGPAGFEG